MTTEPGPIEDILSHARTGHGINLEAEEVRLAAEEIKRLRLGLQKIRDGEVEVGDGTVWSAMGMMQAVAEWTLEGKDISPIT